MTPTTYEVTVHRLGGREPDGIPWTWLGRCPITTAAGTSTSVHVEPKNGNASVYMRVTLEGWEPGPASGWFAARMTLEAMNGQPIGMRPALVPLEPYDVPAYVGFLDDWSGAVYSVGLRRLPDVLPESTVSPPDAPSAR